MLWLFAANKVVYIARWCGQVRFRYATGSQWVVTSSQIICQRRLTTSSGISLHRSPRWEFDCAGTFIVVDMIRRDKQILTCSGSQPA